MLCKIKARGNDHASRQLSFMRAIRAVATAAAGSTPTCPASTAVLYDGSSYLGGANEYEAIIDVIDNTSAGGWTEVSNQTTLPADGTYTTQANNQADSLVLRAPGGKTGFQNMYFGLMTTAYNTTESGEHITAWHYCTNDAHDFASSNPNFVGGTTSQNIVSSSAAGANASYGGLLSNSYDNSGYVNSYQGVGAFFNDREYYVLATEEVLHVHCINYSGGFWHIGHRYSQAWEDTYPDNPYWTVLCHNDGIAADHSNSYYWARMRYHRSDLQTDGVTSIKSHHNDNVAMSTYGNPVTGAVSNSTTNMQNYPQYIFNGERFNNVGTVYLNTGVATYPNNSTGVTGVAASSSSYKLQAPLIHSNMGHGGTAIESVFNNSTIGVVGDPTTGSWVPAARPIEIKMPYGWNMGGALKYLQHGPTFANNADLQFYSNVGSIYQINGENWLCVSYGYTSLASHYGILWIKAT